eukprot:gnl/Trimastix_PCT/2897.p1 GENE.gnl/Trimastix_PCT/2897~~gnl/Trimastix_PCT/2897.p1  ORF type:complete len:212 (+),score=20.90 gnl/Trimastix_PCT/2897:43-636(+)
MADITGGKKTAIVSGGRKKIHTTWEDGREMVEEFDLQTDALLVRKLRSPTELGGEGEWHYEIGEPPPRASQIERTGFSESSSNPFFFREDTSEHFQWKVRNLPYSRDHYRLAIEDRTIVIRTTNKKYFKRFNIPDMDRLNQPLQASQLTFDHSFNTLSVKYRKPPTVVRLETQARTERRQMKAERPPRDGDVDCKPS